MKHTGIALLVVLLSALAPLAAQAEGVQAQPLMTSPIEGVEGREVIASRVYIPPHTTLPKHWHPGEEYAYVMEGSTTLWQEGKGDVVVGAGEMIKIPVGQVHTASTGDEGATVLIFRVHEQGKPVRVNVE